MNDLMKYIVLSALTLFSLNTSIAMAACGCSTSYAGQYEVVTNNLPLGFRSEHSSTSTKIGTLPKGAVVDVTAGNGAWAHVTYNGINGYASMQYLRKVASTSTNSTSSSLQPSVVLNTPNSGMQNVSLGATNDTCYCSTAYAGKYTVTTKNLTLRLRSKHSTDASSKTLANMPKGTVVDVSAMGNGWAHVTYNGITGYASSEYLTKNEVAAPANVLKGDVNGDGKVDLTDLAQFELYLAKMKDSLARMDNADINGDGKPDLSDLARLNLHVAGVQLFDSNGKTIEYVDISEGWYKITSAHDSSKGLDVIYSDKGNGTNIILYNYNDTNNQKFYIKKESDGCYSIKAGHCDMYLDVAAANSASGTNVQLYEGNGTNAQRWRFIPAEGGNYYIESKLRKNLVFDCTGTNPDGSINIRVWNKENKNQHKWALTNVSAPCLPTPTPIDDNADKLSVKGYYHPLGYNLRNKIAENIDSTNKNTNHDYIIGEGTPVYATFAGYATYKQSYYNGPKNIYNTKQTNYNYNKLITPGETVSYGNQIEIRSTDGKFMARYAHLKSYEGVAMNPNIKPVGNRPASSFDTYKDSNGQLISSSSIKSWFESLTVYESKWVERGQLIGYVGNTGNAYGSKSQGYHLHFELLYNGTRLEPNDYLRYNN